MKKLRILIAFIILLSILGMPSTGVEAETRMAYRYVVPGGSLTSTYCTRQEPCDLNYAIYMADPEDILIVHSGTYTSYLPGDDFIIIDKNLTLRGSCQFDNSTPFICYPDERNSFLDGGGNKRVIRVAGTGTEVVHIEGFTITNGIGTGMAPCDGTLNKCGGGIHASNLENLVLKNNAIFNNYGGSNEGLGGGLFANDINYLQVENNRFSFNQATETGFGGGGAAFVVNSGGPHGVFFENNQFYRNEISSDNLTISGGGAVAITDSNNVKIFQNSFERQNDFYKNYDLRGSSLYISRTSGFSIEGNIFKGDHGRVVTFINYALEGQISKNKWWNTTGNYNLELSGYVQADIINNFLGKQMLSTLSRGGHSSNIYIHSDDMSGYNDIKILFNTLAAANYGVEVGQYSSVDIGANIFTDLTGPIFLPSSNFTANIDRNLFYNNPSNANPGFHPIYADPKLVDVANGDFHLLPDSGAIDQVFALDFDEDIDGDTRPIGLGPTPYDVGADEYQVKNYLPLIMH